MARTKKQLDNLEKGKATRFAPGDTQGKKAASKLGNEKKRQIRSARQIMNEWGGKSVDNPTFKSLIKTAGLSDDTGRGLLLAASIVHGVKKGDKALINMAFEYMGENKPEAAPDDGFVEALKAAASEAWDGEGDI